MKFYFPNYKKNIINVSSTFSKMLGKDTDVFSNKKLEKYLKNDYKNVVFIILDGFGIGPIKAHLSKDNFLRKNIKQTLTSVFPSTTTNATTTLMSGDYPFNHGWFGWSIYFKDLDRAVDVYTGEDSCTGEKIDSGYALSKLPYEPFYKDAKNYEVNKVFPVYVKDGILENNYTYTSNEEMFEKIKMCCRKDGKQFIYSYNGEPDSTMHRYSVNSDEAHQKIMELCDLIEDLRENTRDTLIVVTADHGHIDIDGYVEIYKNEQLLSFLERPMTLEPRATSFKVKEDKKEEFVKMFNNCYGKDFKLYNVDYLINKGVFGNYNEKNRDILGDYIAVCKNNKQFVLRENSNRFKGHHTSFTKEMLVPLIIVD